MIGIATARQFILLFKRRSLLLILIVRVPQTQAIHEARRHRLIIHHRWLVVLRLALVAVLIGASTVWFVRHRYTSVS